MVLMKKEKKQPDQLSIKDMTDLVKALKSTGFQEYVQYIQSPRRVMMMSFISGIFKGLGVLVGMTIVVSLLIWILTQLVNFPLIGQHFENILKLVEQMTPQN